jgi:hypothetical protein
MVRMYNVHCSCTLYVQCAVYSLYIVDVLTVKAPKKQRNSCETKMARKVITTSHLKYIRQHSRNDSHFPLITIILDGRCHEICLFFGKTSRKV